MATKRFNARARADELIKKVNSSLYVDTCRKIRKTDRYELTVRGDNEIVGGVFEELGDLFDTSVSVSAGTEWSGCCELCACEVGYLEIDLGGALIPI